MIYDRNYLDLAVGQEVIFENNVYKINYFNETVVELIDKEIIISIPVHHRNVIEELEIVFRFDDYQASNLFE